MDHSKVIFSAIELRITFTNESLATVRADGSFEVPARGVVPLAFVANVTDVPLGDAASLALESTTTTAAE